MGYFWNELDRTWMPRPRWARTAQERHRASRRGKLLTELAAEIEDGAAPAPPTLEGEDQQYLQYTKANERAAKLYAALLARALIGTDECLMKQWGKGIVELTAGGEKVSK